MSTCHVKDCKSKYHSRGYCGKHYKRWAKYGDPLITAWERDENGSGESCSIKSCKGKYEARGYCNKHYLRWRIHGNPLIMKIAEKGSGCVRKDGYKLISVNKRQVLEHRHVMEQKLGSKLKSHEIVHHKDGNGSNNEEENLKVINGIGKHRTMHKTDWDSMTHRTCTKCKKRKKVKFFYRYKSGVRVGAYCSRCKKCCCEYDSSHYIQLRGVK